MAHAAGKPVSLGRIVGAFLVIASILMFVAAGIQLFEVASLVPNTEKCLSTASTNDEVSACSAAVKDAAGFELKASQPKLIKDARFWGAVLVQVAFLMFWAAVFMIGSSLYSAGGIAKRVAIARAGLRNKALRKKKKR